MLLVKLCCPNRTCGRRLQVRVKSKSSSVKIRCPACSKLFAVRLRQQRPPAPAEEEGGTYGLARETSLSYLLRREQDGHELSASEQEDKERLIDERLAADPDSCPACEARMSRREIVCPQCELNLKTGRRPRIRPEAPAAAKAAGAPRVFDEEAAEEIAEGVIDIISEFFDRDR